jgi:methyl coenzyme M reductase subunit D
LDKLTFLVQELEEEVGRAIKLSKTNEIATAEFTVGASDRANKILSFDASGDLTVTEGKVDTVTATASGLSAGATPTATATYTGSTGALAIAFGIPAGATGPTGPAGGGLADLSADTTPQLGGDLDMNGQDIVTTSNATIDLAPNGTGTVVVKGNTNPGTIVFNCESNSHGQTVKAQPHSAAVTNTLTLPPGGDGEIVSTVATQQLTNKVIPDDQNLSFGTDSDAFIKYDETTTDHLKIGGAVTTFEKAAVGATDTDTTNTGNVTLDFDASQNFVLTLTGNVTLVNPNTENVGQSGFIVFIQDATGGRTVSTSTDYETAGGAGLTLSSAASTTDIVPYVVAASNRILLGAPQLAFA